MSEQIGRFATARTISRGVSIAPILSKGLGITFLLALFGSLGRVVIPIFIQMSIDNGLDDGNFRVSYIASIGAITAVIVGLAAFALRQAVYRLGASSEHGLYEMRVKLYEHIHKLSMADHNTERRGALVSRITSDIENLAMFFSWGAVIWLLDGSLMFIVACVMLSYDWILALVAFSVSAPLFVVLRSLQHRLAAEYDHGRKMNAELLSSVSELISGVETLHAYQGQTAMLGRTKLAVKKRARAYIRAGVIGSFLYPSGEVFAVFTIASIVVVGVLRGVGGGLTAGAMIGFIFLTYRFLEPISEFTEVIDQTQAAVAGLRRVLGVLDTPVGPPPPTHPKPIPKGSISIELREVSFSYGARGDDENDDLPVLRNVSLKIPAKQHVALVGKSGSGKTTLARLISRLADPTVGSVLVSGVNLMDIDNSELRQRLVVVPQEPFLFSDSIANNLLFAKPDASREQLMDVVNNLELGDWLESLQHGLDTQVGQRGSSLSAGERQLVALIRAALTNPDVLILDEATSAVDAKVEVQLARALQTLSSGRTTVSIAHRLSTGARADRVVVVDRGLVIEDGPHEVLISANGVYAQMYSQWVTSTGNETVEQ